MINYSLAHDLGRIIVGHSKEWKQKINIGKRNNQNFVNLPHSRFVDMVKYKAQEYGIEVIVREESYTSKASALDFDAIPCFGDKDIPAFSGRRISHGMYRTSAGKQINADINGAINIARKELGDEWLHTLLEDDEGVFVDTPIVIRNNHESCSCGQLLEMGLRSHEAPSGMTG